MDWLMQLIQDPKTGVAVSSRSGYGSKDKGALMNARNAASCKPNAISFWSAS